MYISSDDLVAFLGEDEITDSSAIRIELAINASEEIINGRLSRKFVTPLATPVPAIIKSIALQIARWRFERQGTPYNIELQEYIEKQYKDAMDLLEQVASGDIPLVGAIPAEANTIEFYSNPREWFI